MAPDSAFGHRHVERRRAPDELHALVQEQDDAEGRQHLVEMVAVVEMAEDQHFQQQAEGQRGRQRQQRAPSTKLPVMAVKAADQIGADHVLHAMGEIDEVHHAEHQRQPGGDQEQDEAELQAVQDLDEERGSSVMRRTSLQCGAGSRADRIAAVRWESRSRACEAGRPIADVRSMPLVPAVRRDEATMRGGSVTVAAHSLA